MPSITAWTKLEAQAHHEEIEDGLAARLYDPLWLLARQWQMREFAAEDAGWPVTARLRLKQLPLTRIHLGALPENGHAQGQPYRPDALPLEALVERERVHGPHAAPITRRLAAEAGLHFLALLAHHGAPELCDSFRAAFPLMPPDVEQEKLLDLRSRRFLSVMGRRAADGEALYIAFRAAGGPSALPPVSATQQPRLLAAMDAYVRWYEDLFCEPVSDDPLPSSRAWLPERMEYTFALSARDDDEEIVLQAPEYHGARLDWYSVDVAPTLTLGSDGDGPQSKTVTSLSVPAGVRYRGLPTPAPMNYCA